MPVELSDDEARVLRGSKALLDKLLANPKHKRGLERMAKDVEPSLVTTDDVLEPVESEIKELRKEFKEYLTTQKGRELDSKLEQGISYLKKERDFTDEGIEKLKKLMVDKEIPDIVVAADHWERQNPPKQQEPSIVAPTDWGFGRKSDDTDWNELFADEDAWAEKEARRAWAEESAKKGQIIT